MGTTSSGSMRSGAGFPYNDDFPYYSAQVSPLACRNFRPSAHTGVCLYDRATTAAQHLLSRALFWLGDTLPASSRVVTESPIRNSACDFRGKINPGVAMLEASSVEHPLSEVEKSSPGQHLDFLSKRPVLLPCCYAVYI